MASIGSKLQRRLAQDSGFTLIELLIVLVIIAILLTIAVPSYLGFKERANDAAAKANVRAAVPAVETYFADNGTYVGMTLGALQSIDGGLRLSHVGTVTNATFCVDAEVGGRAWNKAGPAALIAAGLCT